MGEVVKSRSAGSGRRRFFKKLAVGAAAANVIPSALASNPVGNTGGGASARAQAVYNMRLQLAQSELNTAAPVQTPNNDEQLYSTRIGNYSKCLPHNDLGEVDHGAYDALVAAANSGRPSDFEAIPLGLGRKLHNPQAGLAYGIEGADTEAFAQKPAPALASAEAAGEMAEIYWMALLRDVPFRNYQNDPLASRAATDLSRLSNFKGPTDGGRVTPGTLFRDITPGCTVGPYISQFLWQPAPFGAELLNRQVKVTASGVDYGTSYSDWLNLQRGTEAYRPSVYDPTRRYLRNGRDLGEWVHLDVLFQAYFTALLCMMNMGVPVDSGNPYLNYRRQASFATFGDPYIASLVCGLGKSALQAVWFQKWFVHRRLRPEAYGGRVHNLLTGAANYPLHVDIVNSFAPGDVMQRFGTYLLPLAFPEGSPTHPSYGAGHATVAGACTTILKAFYNENFVIPGPVQATADGLALEPYRDAQLTVGGELNKLAANIAHGRNIAGVHWRSDAVESMKLGEALAIRYLQQERACFNEDFGGYSLTKFDGTTITV